MIEKRMAEVYYSSAANRRFFTKRAAIRAEVRSIIENRYPSEPVESDEIGITYGGFHWTELPNVETLYRRVTRLVEAKLK